MAITEYEGNAVQFGIDLWNDGDLDPTMREVTGEELARQALARRLDTRLGQLPEDPNYGTPLEEFSGEDMDAAGLQRVSLAVTVELQKDDLVSAIVSVRAFTEQIPGSTAYAVYCAYTVILVTGFELSDTVAAGPELSSILLGR